MKRSPIPALTLVLLALPLCSALACTTGRETTVAGYDARWDALGTGDKMAHMHAQVEPAMREAFQSFDAERFADFDCQTCHGPGVDDGSYAMPNPALPHLREAGMFKEHRKADPEISKFMWKEVELPMADLLGQTAGPKGEFACWSCHIVDDRHE